ncbi:MAG: hypothetical protein JSR47_04135 [Proteobacteria bacterium]|nr:hypothetical protein [Pseudomonadota bacterium]MBS0548188.1 hypothetical protein [Pseudomonadota bacterium]
MSIRTSTLLLTTLAAGMMASAYFIGAAPAATATAAAPSVARQAAIAKAPATPPASTIKAMRPPVPFVTRSHDSYVDVSALPATEQANANPAIQQASLQDDSPAGMAAARASIEMDGYRNVRGLVKSADGSWRGRAMRGKTEIGIVVDASGSVSAE